MENFPNLGKDTDIKIQEAQRTPIRFNKNWPSTRHIIVKFTKYSEKETQSQKQAPGSEPSAQSPTRGSNSQTARS